MEQRQNKNRGKINDRCDKQLPGRGIRSAKSKARGVAAKEETKRQNSRTIAQCKCAASGEKEAKRDENQRNHKTLPNHNTILASARGQDEISRACIVLSVHPGDGHEMWKLPQKNRRVEDPRLGVQASARRNPTNEWRHSARKSTYQGA